MPKVTKKIEKFARAIAIALREFSTSGILENLGTDTSWRLVDERWHEFIESAEDFNNHLLLISDDDLEGFYFEN